MTAPEPLHEVACPECGTTIRARMADQPGQDLRELLKRELYEAWGRGVQYVEGGFGAISFEQYADAISPAVQAYVDSQVAAAVAAAKR